MPEQLAALLASPSASPTGNPIDTTAGGRVLALLAVGALVALFVAAVARSLMRNHGA